jgi:pimeloyl-ACP methyl ester carboxylesterase
MRNCHHRNGDTMNLWSPLFLQGLAQKRKLYIFDNRGAGLTTSGTKPFSIEQFAKDTTGFIRAMGYDKTDLLGFSMGSRIAAQLTIDQPALIKKAVLYGCASGGPAEIKRSAAVQKLFADTSGTPEQNRHRGRRGAAGERAHLGTTDSCLLAGALPRRRSRHDVPVTHTDGGSGQHLPRHRELMGNRLPVSTTSCRPAWSGKPSWRPADPFRA